MDLIFHNHSVNQLSTLKSVLWTYNQVRYGLKFYLWTNKDKKATYAYFKDNGLMDKYRIAPNRRQSDGSYNSDGSDFDWDSYNRDVWKLYSDDYDSKTSPESLGLNSVKAVQEQKNKLLVYFLENYADKVDIEFKSSPMSIKTPLVDDNGISITLLSRNPEFSIKSPNGAIELVITKSKEQFVTTIKDNCDRPSILIPQLGLPLFEKMFHYASIVSDKPTNVMNNPYYHLGLEVNIERQFQSAQLFLLDQNKLAISRRQEQKTKYEPKSLTHDNFSDAPKPTASDKIMTTTTNDNTKITKNVKVNYHTDKSNEPLYQWDYIHSLSVNNDTIHYYGVHAKTFMTWISNDELYDWGYYEHLYLCIHNELSTIDFDLTTKEKVWTIDARNYDIENIELIYLTEEKFQLFYSLCLKDNSKTTEPTKSTTYEWDDIRYGVDNITFYGIAPKDLIAWLDETEETFNWIEDERIFIYNPDVEFGLDPITDYDDEDAWTLNGLKFRPFAKNTVFYIDETDFQLYYSLSLKNNPVTMN